MEQKSPAKENVAGSHAPNPLVSVIVWELKRQSANIWNWVAVGTSFLVFLGMVWLKHSWLLPSADSGVVTIVGTTAVGLLWEYIYVLLLVYALFIPFVVTDGVTRDYKQRMHEVLMATPVKTWAYVGGRFIAMLCVSLGLAVLMLIAGNVTGQLLAQSRPEIPSPDFRNSLIVWAVTVIPATIFLTGVGFTLGTLWPRRSTTMMLAILITWVLLFVLGNNLYQLFNRLYLYMEPTSVGVLAGIYPQFNNSLHHALLNVPAEQQARAVLQVQSVLPDLSAWVLPHCGVALFGVALVCVAVAGFKRFRDVLS